MQFINEFSLVAFIVNSPWLPRYINSFGAIILQHASSAACCNLVLHTELKRVCCEAKLCKLHQVFLHLWRDKCKPVGAGRWRVHRFDHRMQITDILLHTHFPARTGRLYDLSLGCFDLSYSQSGRGHDRVLHGCNTNGFVGLITDRGYRTMETKHDRRLKNWLFIKMNNYH